MRPCRGEFNLPAPDAAGYKPFGLTEELVATNGRGQG
jgi:hypothetical protein